MKLKTHKTTAKKIRVTNPGKNKKSKLMTKHAGQDHFNARDSGKVGRRKRRDKSIAKSDEKNIRRQIPYS